MAATDFVFSKAVNAFYFSDLLVGLLEYLTLRSDLSFVYLLRAGLKLFRTCLTSLIPPAEADLRMGRKSTY